MWIKFLCEAAEKKEGLNVNLTSVFTFIGMVFSIVVSLVALVWVTCFVVRLLIKTFKKQVQNSYDIFVENSEAKTKNKKERNAIKRDAKAARKMELLNMKEESRERIHKMKVEKLGIKLNENENKAKEKYGVVVDPDMKEKIISDKSKNEYKLEKDENEKTQSKEKGEEPKKDIESEIVNESELNKEEV